MTRARTAGVRSTAAVLARESLHTVIAAANKSTVEISLYHSLRRFLDINRNVNNSVYHPSAWRAGALSCPRVNSTARKARARKAMAISVSGEGRWRVGVPSRKGSKNLEEALNAECMRIATTTARPDELNPYAISSDNPTTIRMYVQGEELLQLTRNSGACHRAHMTPTHIPATQGGIIPCK
jgi:hypothetical protein